MAKNENLIVAAAVVVFVLLLVLGFVGLNAHGKNVLAARQAEQERVAAEERERERQEQERARLAEEQKEREEQERQRVAAEALEREQKEREEAEQRRLAAEKQEREKQERAEQERQRIAAEKAEQERRKIAAEQERQRLAAQQRAREAEQERQKVAAEQKEQDDREWRRNGMVQVYNNIIAEPRSRRSDYFLAISQASHADDIIFHLKQYAGTPVSDIVTDSRPESTYRLIRWRAEDITITVHFDMFNKAKRKTIKYSKGADAN